MNKLRFFIIKEYGNGVIYTKKIEVLNAVQQKFVEKNLNVVRWTIYKHIRVNETVFGLSYDDLFQEGCIWLCKAACTYDGKSAKFETYAKVVVKNGLYSYCRNKCTAYGRQLSLQKLLDSFEKDSNSFLDFLSVEDFTNTMISELNVIDLLESIKEEYNGMARLGIDALKLKVKGFSGSEISRFYGVAPNHIGAWISRAAQRLRKNDRFLMGIQRNPC